MATAAKKRFSEFIGKRGRARPGEMDDNGIGEEKLCGNLRTIQIAPTLGLRTQNTKEKICSVYQKMERCKFDMRE